MVPRHSRSQHVCLLDISFPSGPVMFPTWCLWDFQLCFHGSFKPSDSQLLLCSHYSTPILLSRTIEISLRLLGCWLRGLTVLPPLSASWALLGLWLPGRANIKFYPFSPFGEILYGLSPKPPHSLDPTSLQHFFFSHAEYPVQFSKRLGFWSLELGKLTKFTLTQ